MSLVRQWCTPAARGKVFTMTSPTSPSTTAAAAQTCCRRPMSSIEVTTRGTTLVLHSCTACGRHLWQKDGQVADRAELIDGVKTFLEQPRVATPRRSRKRS
jgi:hypothetical protein